jgi:hypothetical protein
MIVLLIKDLEENLSFFKRKNLFKTHPYRRKFQSKEEEVEVNGTTDKVAKSEITLKKSVAIPNLPLNQLLKRTRKSYFV